MSQLEHETYLIESIHIIIPFRKIFHDAQSILIEHLMSFYAIITKT